MKVLFLEKPDLNFHNKPMNGIFLEGKWWGFHQGFSFNKT